MIQFTLGGTWLKSKPVKESVKGKYQDMTVILLTAHQCTLIYVLIFFFSY